MRKSVGGRREPMEVRSNWVIGSAVLGTGREASRGKVCRTRSHGEWLGMRGSNIVIVHQGLEHGIAWKQHVAAVRQTLVTHGAASIFVKKLSLPVKGQTKPK